MHPIPLVFIVKENSKQFSTAEFPPIVTHIVTVCPWAIRTITQNSMPSWALGKHKMGHNKYYEIDLEPLKEPNPESYAPVENSVGQEPAQAASAI